ncbi:hypothetical protein BLNAU_4272 [Blattamonas nauphoetae]|uniref:RRM domain-containing protein n=1 Tax=Blattamonas nauphoetae TaxID=2049346 RepID=A0ABQ9YB16_9EUKA|nr:hypothetical protein BLNAU_4272 [Blattamonas nauphoetae]
MHEKQLFTVRCIQRSHIHVLIDMPTKGDFTMSEKAKFSLLPNETFSFYPMFHPHDYEAFEGIFQIRTQAELIVLPFVVYPAYTLPLFPPVFSFSRCSQSTTATSLLHFESMHGLGYSFTIETRDMHPAVTMSQTSGEIPPSGGLNIKLTFDPSAASLRHTVSLGRAYIHGFGIKPRSMVIQAIFDEIIDKEEDRDKGSSVVLKSTLQKLRSSITRSSLSSQTTPQSRMSIFSMNTRSSESFSISLSGAISLDDLSTNSGDSTNSERKSRHHSSRSSNPSLYSLSTSSLNLDGEAPSHDRVRSKKRRKEGSSRKHRSSHEEGDAKPSRSHRHKKSSTDNHKSSGSSFIDGTHSSFGSYSTGSSVLSTLSSTDFDLISSLLTSSNTPSSFDSSRYSSLQKSSGLSSAQKTGTTSNLTSNHTTISSFTSQPTSSSFPSSFTTATTPHSTTDTPTTENNTSIPKLSYSFTPTNTDTTTSSPLTGSTLTPLTLTSMKKNDENTSFTTSRSITFTPSNQIQSKPSSFVDSATNQIIPFPIGSLPPSKDHSSSIPTLTTSTNTASGDTSSLPASQTQTSTDTSSLPTLSSDPSQPSDPAALAKPPKHSRSKRRTAEVSSTTNPSTSGSSTAPTMSSMSLYAQVIPQQYWMDLFADEMSSYTHSSFSTTLTASSVAQMGLADVVVLEDEPIPHMHNLLKGPVDPTIVPTVQLKLSRGPSFIPPCFLHLSPPLFVLTPCWLVIAHLPLSVSDGYVHQRLRKYGFIQNLVRSSKVGHVCSALFTNTAMAFRALGAESGRKWDGSSIFLQLSEEEVK